MVAMHPDFLTDPILKWLYTHHSLSDKSKHRQPSRCYPHLHENKKPQTSRLLRLVVTVIRKRVKGVDS